MIKMEKITKKMVLGEVIIKYPETQDVFFKYGLPCAMCHLASGETVEQAAESYGVKLEKLLKDLNKAVKKK
jgi:hybrid cluster-associated redox disulfide protein